MKKMSEEIKISQLQEANEISANDLMMIIQNGVNKKKNIKQMAKELSTVAVSATQPITNKKVWFKIGKNKFDKSRYIENIATGASRTKNLKLEPNTVYTMSSNMPKTSSNTADLFFASGCNASVSTDANGVWDGQSRTVTSDENGYVTVAYRKQSTSQTPNLMDAWYQIEQGSTATSYEAYIEPEIYVRNDNNVYEKLVKQEKILHTAVFEREFNNVSTQTNVEFDEMFPGLNLNDIICFNVEITNTYSTWDRIYAHVLRSTGTLQVRSYAETQDLLAVRVTAFYK